jgi:plastocyanin
VRAALLAMIGLALAPATSQAATRPVQAVDRAGGLPPVWTPSELTAQPGDTIRWQFEQPGNPNAAGSTHDLRLTRPGEPEAQVAVSYLNPSFEETVSEGTYTFRCAIHPDTMTGTIVVAAGDPTPVIDPGRPWDAPAPADGPAPALNPTTPPVTFESGDNQAPTLRITKVKKTRRAATVTVKVSEPGELLLRLLDGTRTVATKRTQIKGTSAAATIRLPARKHRYRLAITAQDAAGLESTPRYEPISVRTSSSSGKNVRSSAARKKPTPDEPPVPRL